MSDADLLAAPDNSSFYTDLIPLATLVCKDCKALVARVNDMNESVVEEDTTGKSKTFVAAAKRVPKTADEIIRLINDYVKQNSEFYEDDPDQKELYQALRKGSRGVKESVLLLVRLATVSAYRTKSSATATRTQSLLDTYCRDVASAIKQVTEAAEVLRLLEENEEEDVISHEAEEWAELIKTQVVELAKSASMDIKQLVSAVQGTNETSFVQRAKISLESLNNLIDFAKALLIDSAGLKEATVGFVSAAKMSFKQKSAHSVRLLESKTVNLASAIRAVVVETSRVDTVALVKLRLDQAESATAAAASPTALSGLMAAPGFMAAPPPPEEEDEETSVVGPPGAKLSQRQIAMLRKQLKKRRPPGEMGSGARKARSARKTPRKRERFDPSKVNMVYYRSQLPKIVLLQNKLRSLVRRQRFKNATMEYLIHESSERTRKRNLALREIVFTEQLYVTQLQELEEKLIIPLQESSASFAKPDDVDGLFSAIVSIISLNVQILELMENRMDEWPANTLFADIFVKKASVFRLYTEFFSSYESLLKLLDDLEAKSGFKEFVKSVKLSKGIRNYFILPVQRLPRYQILLEALRKYTPENHVDYPNIVEAFKKICDLNDHVDQRKADNDNKTRLQNINAVLQGYQITLHRKRKYIKEGFFETFQVGKKKDTSLYCFLFTDMLLVTKTKKKPGIGGFTSKDKFKHKLVIKFDATHVCSALAEEGKFEVLRAGGDRSKVYVFELESPATSRRWVDEIKKRIAEGVFDL